MNACGPSGSGKSTLLNLVGGLRIPEVASDGQLSAASAR